MIDAVIVNEWWWTGSCEYADVVFGVDSWGEYNVHDITNSCTNPFMQVMPLSPLPRLHNTRSDTQTYAGVAAKLAEITGDRRFEGYWAFIENGKGAPYIQRILDHSNITRGYRFEDLLEKAEKGVPAMMMGRSYPKFMGYEQSVESMPWYNRTGRSRCTEKCSLCTASPWTRPSTSPMRSWRRRIRSSTPSLPKSSESRSGTAAAKRARCVTWCSHPMSS
jgi:nitrate reductase alpha subunit